MPHLALHPIPNGHAVVGVVDGHGVALAEDLLAVRLGRDEPQAGGGARLAALTALQFWRQGCAAFGLLTFSVEVACKLDQVFGVELGVSVAGIVYVQYEGNGSGFPG